MKLEVERDGHPQLNPRSVSQALNHLARFLASTKSARSYWTEIQTLPAAQICGSCKCGCAVVKTFWDPKMGW